VQNTFSAIAAGSCDSLTDASFSYTNSQAGWFLKYTTYDQFGLVTSFLASAQRSATSGAGCYYFLMCFSALFLGLGLASSALVTHRLRTGTVKRSEAALEVGCCGSGGGGGLGDPCIAVAMVATTFGVSLPLAVSAWPIAMAAALVSVLSWGQLGSVTSVGTTFATGTFTLGAGYGLACAAVGCQMVALILVCTARDAYREHAYSGVTPRAAAASNTVVVMQPAGMAFVPAGASVAFPNPYAQPAQWGVSQGAPPSGPPSTYPENGYGGPPPPLQQPYPSGPPPPMAFAPPPPPPQQAFVPPPPAGLPGTIDGGDPSSYGAAEKV
jgi:hypothetical protein